MQLGIRLHDTKKLPFEERIANVHELGFACGHLAPVSYTHLTLPTTPYV